jgi:hypothetical protein
MSSATPARSSKRADELFETIKDRLEAGNFEAQEGYIDRLLEQGHTPTDIAGALFTLLRESVGREGEEIHEDREPVKKERPERVLPRERKEEREPRREAGPPARTQEREPRREAGPPARTQERERPWQEEKRPSRGPERADDRGRGDAGGGWERKPERAPFKKKSGPDTGMASLFINIGKDEGVIAGEIAGMLYREAGIPNGSVGRISLFKRHTLVDVREDIAEDILRNVGKAKLKGRPVRLKLDEGGRQKY